MQMPSHHHGFGLPITHRPIEFIDRYAYTVGGLGLLSPAGEAMEVLPMQSVYWVPGLPRHVSGVLGVHGLLVPVVSLALLLEPPATTTAQWLLVIGTERASVGFAIDTLPVKRRFDRADRIEGFKCPPALQPHVRDVFPQAPRTAGVWLDFDHESFVNADAFG